MKESARRFKANRRIEGRPCGWCSQPLALGDAAAVCGQCEIEHHEPCWDQHGGCARDRCPNAPLAKLPDQAVAPVVATPAGQKACLHCGEMIDASSQLCAFCNGVLSPDGIYHGPKTNAPGAVSSLVYGIVGLFICGLILGVVAIQYSKKAKAAMALDPHLGGEGLATAGFVMGVIDIIAWGIIVIMRATGGF